MCSHWASSETSPKRIPDPVVTSPKRIPDVTTGRSAGEQSKSGPSCHFSRAGHRLELTAHVYESDGGQVSGLRPQASGRLLSL
jgi:hypothetical protein